MPPLAGQTCQQRHLAKPSRSGRTLHPVISEQVAGDLDPLQSGRYMTTGKQTYLKLRHLVDTGCLLVGHGLKKDFRMINIVVPPEQVNHVKSAVV